ncbi:MAG: Smr/MutS family protein [Spirochaetaceae bacterium]|jgi:DNA mismatch repair protein MutS2|nr:Smr/MutS family protein [Spirochaetaceae bacterium]
MNGKTLSLLEFQAIQNAVADAACSAEAASLLRASWPETDAGAARELKALVACMLDRLNAAGEEPAGNLPEIGPFLSTLGVEGAALEREEAFALGVFVERGERFAAWAGGGAGAIVDGNDTGVMESILSALPDCGPVRVEVFRVLDREGNLRDLPELREIRRRIRSLTAERDALIARYTGTEETRRILQSDLPSQRDGRVVLAVKANFRGRVRGIVHEVSATGRTIFLEPEDVVEKNNAVMLEQRRLDAEIRRIIRELTARVSVFHDALAVFHAGILRLETLRARARYSRSIRGVFAKEGDTLILEDARHPLLGAEAIPISLSMAARAVIITGPNTGGKTVTLKTAGLFALMNQWGLALPAGEGTTLPLFGGIHADIGDEQSLRQSLSTFSAHMTNIAAIAGEAGPDALVLLDELGSGTDPEEGSAIAMAILDHLAEKGSRVMITTHHGALKNYGYTRSGVENASVEFDARTLSPTYRIVMGIPGESRAVDIAARNGVPAGIIEGARAYLAGNQADLAGLIAELKTRRKELETAHTETDRETARLREERRRADLRELRLRQKEAELKTGGVGQLRLLLSEARKTLENLVREVREGEITREKTLKVKEFLSGLAGAVETEEAALAEESALLRAERARLEHSAGTASQADADGASTPPGRGRRKGKEAANVASTNAASANAVSANALREAGAATRRIEPGMTVMTGAWNRRGTVIRREKGGWLVETGSLRLTLPEADLVPVETAAAPRPLIERADLAPVEVKIELSLRGMRLDEALETLRRQIDAAVIAGVGGFAVVHGKGDGVLQKGVHDYLKGRGEVAGYSFSRPELGGFGRTEVTLHR